MTIWGRLWQIRCFHHAFQQRDDFKSFGGYGYAARSCANRAFQHLGSRRKSIAKDCSGLIEGLIVSLGSPARYCASKARSAAAIPARYLRCPPLYLAQAARSKDRCERTAWGGALQRGCLDERCNKYSFVRLPRPHSPLRGVDGESDRFYSSAFTTRECVRTDVFFATGPWPPDRIFTYTQIHRAPDCARG